MDNARRLTEEYLKQIEERLKTVYKQAYSEISEKWDIYMQQTNEQLSILYDMYTHEQDYDLKQNLLSQYKQALQEQTLKNKWFKDMVDQTAYRLANTNKLAIGYVNGSLSDIYMINFNQSVPNAQGLGLNFTLVDEATVRRMIEDNDIKLPYKKFNTLKDMIWNTRQINNAVLQGILQGESISDIAKRLLPIVNNNEKASVRTARTLVTGAENRGRLDRYSDLENQGAIMHKVWIATADSRTRDFHLSLDGQEVDIHDVFIDGNGNELEYPGDPDAPPETIYNCRCSMRSELIGIKKKDGKIKYLPKYEHNGLHQKQIRKEKERRE